MRLPKLSGRLLKIASFVEAGRTLADIGTDHALIPAFLLLKERIPYSYACDIGEGPLERAREQLQRFGLQTRAETRLSDGLKNLIPGEAETVLIAGMGGRLIQKILEDGKNIVNQAGESFHDTVKEWIFSPHTDWREFRHYLRENEFCIKREALILEDGKYYCVIRGIKGDGESPYRAACSAGFSDSLSEYFGPLILLDRDPLLRSFLEREIEKTEKILRQLKRSESGDKEHRIREVSGTLEEYFRLKEKLFPDSGKENEVRTDG